MTIIPSEGLEDICSSKEHNFLNDELDILYRVVHFNMNNPPFQI